MLAYPFGYGTARSLRIPYLGMPGVGLGAVMTVASSTIMRVAPVSRVGMAVSLVEVAYELGGASGVTLMGSILTVVYGVSLLLPLGA
ncbi:hypothetical protein [Stutzerimonas kirkiae]|uniref:hypothetical protein n=1 Tax=Stutzerimonas kirkiae TaxID=2211392 RepID=UPI0010385102|nr:hypothetical protein [Stutzerimonas kirkiae]TBV09544.1 hypothetical protein DNK08_09030 [Stutzerimonas kirkiae]